ncbi:adenosine receptor A2b-like, partial [Orbicella faveolata]|uniref:adenosine receptor A2b-like n=1 Tax=Orbicella faveolata TaxID=48498 RepID=UPI0009E3B6CD
MGPSNHDDDGRKEEPTDLKAIIITIHVLLTVATVFGNSLVIRAFYKFSSLRSASNAILVSLSVADIFMTVSFILKIANIIVGKTPSPRVICSVASTVSLTFNAIIILHLALISVERFIAIKFALRYQMIVTNRRATIASVVVWLWGIAVVLIFPQALKSEELQVFKEFLQALSPCFHRHHEPFRLQSTSVRSYLVFLVVSLLVMPIVIIMMSYSYIFKVAWNQRRQIREENNLQGKLTGRREMKGARTAAIV